MERYPVVYFGISLAISNPKVSASEEPQIRGLSPMGLPGTPRSLVSEPVAGEEPWHD